MELKFIFSFTWHFLYIEGFILLYFLLKAFYLIVVINCYILKIDFLMVDWNWDAQIFREAQIKIPDHNSRHKVET